MGKQLAYSALEAGTSWVGGAGPSAGVRSKSGGMCIDWKTLDNTDGGSNLATNGPLHVAATLCSLASAPQEESMSSSERMPATSARPIDAAPRDLRKRPIPPVPS